MTFNLAPILPQPLLVHHYPEENEWEGLVVHGCVREVDALREMTVGIQAVASIPVGASSQGTGAVDVAINFGGVTFLPEDYLYADSTGVILSQERLDVQLEVDEDDLLAR
ncbi:hypothetical protein [[Leptolyngbya] sp. PCC 7376]|uniref:RraA family protein n=1 Tax=[Leptolyngbya] sp. PCC 7376 TaxID=111781 RepID=UPI0009FD939D|nr:hypothetical protein [[Leptolyngbya] sp. PCC 7376]